MALSITHRSAAEAPVPAAIVSEEFRRLQAALFRLRRGVLLSIEAGDRRSVATAKTLVKRAAQQAGRPYSCWHEGTTVFVELAD